MNEQSDQIRLVAYDPSLINLGYAYGYVEEGVLYVSCVGTFNTDSINKRVGLVVAEADQDVDRGRILGDFLTTSLEGWKPHGVALESAFFNKVNPKSLISQSKASGIIQYVIDAYNVKFSGRMQASIYAPNFIKEQVGVSSGEFKDKTAINRAIMARVKEGKLVYLNESDYPDKHKDHTNDAVAMLYTKYLELKENGYT